MWLLIPEHETDEVVLRTEVELVVDGLPNVVFCGVVEKIHPVPERWNNESFRVVTVTLPPRQTELLEPLMIARLSSAQSTTSRRFRSVAQPNRYPAPSASAWTPAGPASCRQRLGEDRRQVDVALVTMPWAPLNSPSIQLGIVAGLLDREGISSVLFHFNLTFFDHFSSAPSERGLRYCEYLVFVGRSVSLGEWIFAVPPLRDNTAEGDEEYRDFLSQDSMRWYYDGYGGLERAFARARHLRQRVPDFLERCAEEILARNPKVVGFTLSFFQTVPSLALAKLLKIRRPDLHIVFGGQDCKQPMGDALLRLHDWLDVVVTGEVEAVGPGLFRELSEGRPVTARPGLAVRRGQPIVSAPAGNDLVPGMDEVPTPVFDDYFHRLAASPLQNAGIGAGQILPYESTRGCWWGARNKCAFCGHTAAAGMAHRSKSPARVEQELRALLQRYSPSCLFFVDDVIGPDAPQELFERLAAADLPVSLYVNVRSNLTREQLCILRSAGVWKLFAGVESLSTPILKLVGKGVTGLQNIRFLKWCAELDIVVDWALLYGFPGEPPEEYQRMAELVPSLTHLCGPSNGTPRLALVRYSPYFNDPERYGITITGGDGHRRFLLDGDRQDLSDLSVVFEFTYDDGRDPETYFTPCREAVGQWLADGAASYRQLTVRRNHSGIVIRDGRAGAAASEQSIPPPYDRIYLACADGASVAGINRNLRGAGQAPVPDELARGFLDEMVKLRLACVERRRYLSLALATEGLR